jgi:hypothetical protein
LSPQPIDIPIIGESTDRPQDDPEFTLNWYAEKTGKAKTLKPTPGSELNVHFGFNGEGRGIIEANGRTFGVRGAFLQEIVGGLPVLRGTILSLSGKVALVACTTPAGDSQILVVDDGLGYVYKTVDQSFTTLTSGGNGFVGGNSQAAFCGGRAVAIKPGTLQFQVSKPFDFLTWEGTAFATTESLVGTLIGVAANGELVYLFTSTGFEIWQDQGYVPLNLRRVRAGDKLGLLGPTSLLAFGAFVYFLGASDTGEGVVYRIGGAGIPERISDHADERRIADLISPEDAYGWAYQSLGHRFYSLSFVAGNITITFDEVTTLWHDRAWRSPIDGSLLVVPYVGVAVFGGVVNAMDYRNGDLLKVRDDVFTDQGEPIIRDRKMYVVPEEADRLSYYQSVQLFGETGNTPVDLADPQIAFRYSLDRGKTYGEEELRTVGGQSDYEAQTVWTGLGSGFGIVLWFRIVAFQFVSWRSVRLRAE